MLVLQRYELAARLLRLRSNFGLRDVILLGGIRSALDAVLKALQPFAEPLAKLKEACEVQKSAGR